MGASESSEQPPSEGGPLLGREVELGQETTAEHDGGYTDDGVPRDDQDCDLVIVLPMFDKRHAEEKPLKQVVYDYKDIFITNCVPDSKNVEILRKGLADLVDKTHRARGNLKVVDFQECVRTILKQLLNRSGIDLASFLSIDQDEIFMKMKFTSTSVMETYAERVLYKMPFSEDCYASLRKYVEMADALDGEGGSTFNNKDKDVVPKNLFQQQVFAYADYKRPAVEPATPARAASEARKQEFKGATFADFRKVDAIRLMYLRLNELADLKALANLGVIQLVFPAADYEELKALAKKWIGGLQLHVVIASTLLPRHWWGTYKMLDTMDDVRSFFGEQIGFYFLYYRLYLAFLFALVVTSLPYFFSDLVDVDPDSVLGSAIAIWKGHYAEIITIWASLWIPILQRLCCRAAQRWGMRDFQRSFESSRKDFNADVGPKLMALRHFMSYFLLVLFCTLAISCIAGIMVSVDPNWESVAVAAVIKIFSLLWTKISKALVQMQNHRVDSTFISELSMFLTIGKLFLYLFPFLKKTFMDNFLRATCESSMEKLAHAVFDTRGWPTGVSPHKVKEWFPEYTYVKDQSMLDFNQSTVMFQQGLSHPDEDANLLGFTEWATNSLASFRASPDKTICAYGCIPQTCSLDEDGGGTATCNTDCYHDLKGTLSTLYLLHAATTFIFVLIPILMAKFEIEQEKWKADKHAQQGNHEEADKKRTTTLQIQAKKHISAPYEYLQWGGSFVEDILELILGHALLVCFGIFVPRLAPIAFICNLVEYNMLAYRTLNVTGRPYPLPAGGIGLWVAILDLLGMVGAVVNGGLLAYFLRNSFSRETPKDKLIAFFMSAGWLLFLRLVCRKFILPEEPWDVMEADYKNEAFKQQLNSATTLSVQAAESDANISITAPPEPRTVARQRMTAAYQNVRRMNNSMFSWGNTAPTGSYTNAPQE